VNHEVEIKEMLAVARELMREWYRMKLYTEFVLKHACTEPSSKLMAAFDTHFPKEAP
jgi:hypothetical protein